MKIVKEQLLSPAGTRGGRVLAALFFAFGLVSCAGNKVSQSWGEGRHNKSPIYLKINELLTGGRPVHIIVVTEGSVHGVNKDFATARLRQSGRNSVENVEADLAESYKRSLEKDLPKNFGGKPAFKLVERRLLASVYEEITRALREETKGDIGQYNLLGATHIYYVQASQDWGDDNYLNVSSNLTVTEKLIDIKSGAVIADQSTSSI